MSSGAWRQRGALGEFGSDTSLSPFPAFVSFVTGSGEGDLDNQSHELFDDLEGSVPGVVRCVGG